ncbi:MAG: hypothetical protein ACE15C_05295 [Phycisphaerae bacterium]
MTKSQAIVCPECGQPMEEGFIVDFGNENSRHVSSWVKGRPQLAWFYVKVKKKERRAVQTFRCLGRGFLEQYAKKMYGELWSEDEGA